MNAPRLRGIRVPSGLLPLLGLLLVETVLFSRAILGPRVFFQRDIHSVWYPRIEAMVSSVAAGGWPLWDPYTGFGGPALADPSYQVLYPLTWLNLVLLPATYYKLFVLVHVGGAGLGLYLLARRWQLAPLPAFLGAACWMASGPLLSTVSLWHHFAGLCWLPWILLALDAALARGTVGSALILGAAGAGQLLAGSGDVCLMSGAIACAWTLAHLRRSGWAPPALATAGRTGVVGVAFAALLAAGQWMPTAALLASAARVAAAPAYKLYWSLHPATLADLIVPHLLTGFPMSDAARAILMESREPFLPCLYLGAAALLPVSLAFLGKARTPRTVSAALLAFFLVCALGRYTPLYPVLVRFPPFSMFRYPVKYLLPASFLWATLIALGAAVWGRAWSEAERRRARGLLLPAATVALAALLAARWVGGAAQTLAPLVRGDPATALAPTQGRLDYAAVVVALSGLLLWLRTRRVRAPAWLTLCLLALVLGDLVAVGHDVNRLAPRILLGHRPPILAHLGADAGDRRIWVFQPPPLWLNRHLARVPAGWREQGEWGWALGLQDMLAAPIGGRWHLYGSYDGDLTGLAPAAQSLLTTLLHRLRATPAGGRLLELGNVGYVVALEDDPMPGLTRIAELPSVWAEPLRLFRVAHPLPRAYVVGGARAVADAEAYRLLQEPGFDPRREVLVAGGAPSRPEPAGFRGAAELTVRGADRLELETASSAPGLLVVVAAYDPGWRARVDGAPAEVLRANLLFRAVAVPAGHHRVVLEYRPPAVCRGLVLSALGVAVGLGYWEARGRRGARVLIRHAPVDSIDRGSPPRKSA